MTGQDDAAARLPQLDIRPTRGIGQAVRGAYRAHRATAVTQNGFIVAVIIPPEDYHPPGECCCKNFPWGGKHGA